MSSPDLACGFLRNRRSFLRLVGFGVFPRTVPSQGLWGDFSPHDAVRLPLLRFLLFSTYQFQGTRPNPKARPPVVTSNRPRRFRLQGFFVPSWRFQSLGTYATMLQIASAREVYASAFLSRKKIGIPFQIRHPSVPFVYPSETTFWMVWRAGVALKVCSLFTAANLCQGY